MKGGLSLAVVLDYIGQETRFLEWHKGWKKDPVWRKIGSTASTIKNAEKILLCERDAHTGKTLETLGVYLQKLEPTRIDIAFEIDVFGTNQAFVIPPPINAFTVILPHISSEKQVGARALSR